MSRIKDQFRMGMQRLENKIPPPLVALIIAALIYGLPQITATVVLPLRVKYSL